MNNELDRIALARTLQRSYVRWARPALGVMAILVVIAVLWLTTIASAVRSPQKLDSQRFVAKYANGRTGELIDTTVTDAIDSGIVWQSKFIGSTDADATTEAHFQFAFVGRRILVVKTATTLPVQRVVGLVTEMPQSLASQLDKQFANKPAVRSAFLPVVLDVSTNIRRNVFVATVAGLLAFTLLGLYALRRVRAMFDLGAVPAISSLTDRPEGAPGFLLAAQQEIATSAIAFSGLTFTENVVSDGRRFVVPADEVSFVRSKTGRMRHGLAALIPKRSMLTVGANDGRSWNVPRTFLRADAVERARVQHPRIDFDIDMDMDGVKPENAQELSK